MSEEIKRLPRKMLRVRARVGTKEGAPFEARTLDVSIGGVCLSAGVQMQVGDKFFVAFDLLINGASNPVAALAEVVYCTYSGDDSFKAGLKFLQFSRESAQALNTYISI